MQDYNTIIGAIWMRLNKCPTRSVMLKNLELKKVALEQGYCSHLTVLPATITAHLKCLYEAGAVITQ